MHNVLVTGGAGFIGSNFICYLLNAEPEIRIVNLDALTYAGSLENLKDLSDPERHIFVHGNICDRNLVAELLHHHRIDTVVHFAAESHVDRSILEPGQFVQTNVVGTFTLLELVHEFWLVEKAIPAEKVRFHHVSTDEVFGSLEPEEPAWTENAPYSPNSPYASSKAASDHLVRAYGHTYGLPYSITNCSNNYGPYQFPEKLIPVIILSALEGHPIPVYGNGKQIRDWLYVEDHCEAIRLVLTKGSPGKTYNIGGNNQPTNLTVVQMFCDIIDRFQSDSAYIPHRDLIRFVEDRPGHDRRYSLNTTRIQRELGWKPAHSLENGFYTTLEWYLNNMEWVKIIRSRPDYQQWMESNYARRRIK